MNNVNLEDFCIFMRSKLRLGEGTIVSRKSRARTFIKWLDQRVITSQTIESFFSFLRTEKNLNNASLNTYLAVLLSLEKYLLDRGNCVPFMKSFKHFKEDEVFIDPLSDSEIQRLITCKVSERFDTQVYSDLITFIAYTGCRLSEALNLKKQYIDLQEGKVSFVHTKTKRIRVVYFVTPVLEVLKRNNNEPFVFLLNGKQINQRAFAFHLERRRLKCGITKRVYPHLLRHSYATASYDDTGDVYLVKELLGHSNIETTLRYTHMSNKRVKNGQLNHPFNQKYIDPKNTITKIEEELRERLFKDARFNPQLVRDAIHEFIGKLNIAF